ncbi:Uncharacterised protein [Enterobacter hormaechei]|nr:hypothetical protein AI2865V1_2789 [Enterobacter cloacae]CZU61109.1 Uncharacterised protein [Enterobacter hormaechei]CAH5340615.1 hypothetical protein AI2865V1_2789 [Enterobacter cloacae]CZU67812.1 Uncharacterised protein [Enterobacter hormaechei]CZU68167.1 Uncharacterised protein [Enterobacter hormaechei]
MIALKRFKKSCLFYKRLQEKLHFLLQNLEVQHISSSVGRFLLMFSKQVQHASAKRR